MLGELKLTLSQEMAISLAPGKHFGASEFSYYLSFSEGTSELKMRLYITTVTEPSSPSTSTMFVHLRNVGACHNMPDPHIPCVCPLCLGELDDEDLYAVGGDLYVTSEAATVSLSVGA